MKAQKFKGTIVFVILLSLSVLLYLYRLKWGMADVDESFYLSIPFRLLQGDALLADEWNLSQLSGLLQYPILGLYLKLFHSTEGIILSFRFIYVVFQIFVSVFTYVVLRKKDETIAVVLAILFFLFTPFNIMALSYNTMGLMSIWILSILLYSYNETKMIPNVVSGIFLAFLVLCNPFMVIAYVLYLIYVCYELCIRKNKNVFVRSVFLTLGAASVFAVFLFFVLSRASMREILENLSMVLTSPAHAGKGYRKLFIPFIAFGQENKWYLASLGTLFILGMWKKNFRNACFCLSSVVTAALVLKFALTQTNGQGYATMMIPLTPLGLIAFCYTEEKDGKLFFWWITGVIYAFFMNMASNNGIYVIANGCTVSSLASFFVIRLFLREQYEIKAARVLFSTLVLLQLFSQVYVCVNHVFWEDGPTALVSEIESGPLKGIVTTEEKANTYRSTYQDLCYIKENYNLKDKYGLLFKKNPWGYLVLDQMRMGAYSAWMSDIAETPDDGRIQIYYTYHPEKTPQMIYVDASSAMVWERKQWKSYSKKNYYDLIEFTGGSYLMTRFK